MSCSRDNKRAVTSQFLDGPGSTTLSKSTFLRGVRCQKSLALDAFHSDLSDPLDLAGQFRMQLGQEVGRLARQRYPGGSVGRIPDSYLISVQRTRDLIDGGADVIYEAAFEADGVRIVADLLVRGERGWRLIEVKSAGEAKPEHRWDVGVQAYIARRAGLRLEDAVLMHMNKEYIRQGSLDYQALFTEESLLSEVDDLEGDIEQSIQQSLTTLESGAVPEVDIGPYCRDPNDCDFIGHCWGHLPEPSVFDVYYIGKKAHDLYSRGIERIEDIPEGLSLDKRSAFHVEAHKAGQTVIKPDRIREFVSSLVYPLYYLDFETFAVPVPPFENLSPYAKVPFQYSLHVQQRPGGELVHSGYLAEPGIDPRDEFLEQLLEETEGDGSIIVFYLPFERSVLKGLMETHPRYSDGIEARIGRMVDLMDPFKQRAYWHPQMGGSNSLKQVLPVFAPDLSYEQMEVSDGDEATATFWGLRDEQSSVRRAELRQALWDYCELDTLGMVRILDGLWELVGA